MIVSAETNRLNVLDDQERELCMAARLTLVVLTKEVHSEG